MDSTTDVVSARPCRWVRTRCARWGLGIGTVVVASVGSVIAVAAAPAQADPRPSWLQNVFGAGVPAENAVAAGTIGQSSYRNASGPICSTTAVGSEARLSCEGNGPHVETSIAVNPTNPQNMIATANDFQLRASSGGTVYVTVLTRADVTFDGGKTWTMYPIKYSGYDFTGDSSVAFDANGAAYVASDAIVVSQDALFPAINPTTTSFHSRGIVAGDIVVARSTDGGKKWYAPVRVATGIGTNYTKGLFNDKAYLTAWGDGNAVITWTGYQNDPHGSPNINEPIEAAVSHDGGATWTAPRVISGAASFCAQSPFTAPTNPPSCDQSNFSVPVVAADGSVHVAFEANGSNSTFRGVYAEVQLDPTTGQRIAGPFEVAGVIDGASDYPFNQYGWQTYQDSQFRTNADGNIAADPTNPSHLAVVWSDMRDSALPAPSDPYVAVTNSDISVSQSYDGGQTWTTPVSLTRPGDQLQPWSEFDSTGHLRIGYYDRSYDPANHRYGYTLATETTPGSLSFTTTELSTALSDPTQGDRWYSASTANSAFPNPTSFMGDYSGLATVPGGGAVAVWTDMRDSTCFTTRCGSAENVYSATVP